ncbi:hypothetical protein MtrunA17_Chr5g0401531 [Medicago truncatula]|uniref:Transmembrane protein n=1 Tax=Medicago truncatula TaxID=3880 RepID=A0A396HN12_MEDTR|nr:hypothetical protein MtrunA17_Chr5g0401531 [Medicago truncatula]
MLRYKCISQPQCLMPCSSFWWFFVSLWWRCYAYRRHHCYILSFPLPLFCAPCIDSSKWKCIGEHHSICIKMEMYCIMIMAMIAFEIYCVYWFNFSLVVSCIT